jgi:hypothetical protein
LVAAIGRDAVQAKAYVEKRLRHPPAIDPDLNFF